MESLKLAFEVITSPFKGFEKLKEKKTFWLPFLLTVILSTAATGYYAFNADMKYVITQKLEKSEKMQQFSKEQADQIINMQSKVAKYAMPIGAFVGSFFFLLIVALYLFTMAKVYTSDLSFKDALAITGNAFFVYLLSTIIFIIILLITDFKTTPVESLMPTNLGYYFSSQALGKKLYTLFTKIDIFGIWFASLLGIGFHIFTEESLTKSFLTVFIPYIALIVISVLLV
ncbi:hypothetical protein TTHT_0960 [Thermotomaculum hydrothermale]|uniref:Yip1 domain-containing protein n=1 Tax=Thermotomaculum hydrothermale TaxID=981385 RepID=A0A7R6PMW2_9BACT|nr:YIP1 family protein [Thermotomaculum hydrothermale]BBB32513.1 hypothetical protein TTHT_0960 [Thermotomaculum hydrothermale]